MSIYPNKMKKDEKHLSNIQISWCVLLLQSLNAHSTKGFFCNGEGSIEPTLAGEKSNVQRQIVPHGGQRVSSQCVTVFLFVWLQVGSHAHAICALSGGVDSAVAAALVCKALGDRLHCVFVDHGLLRYKVHLPVTKLQSATMSFCFTV